MADKIQQKTKPLIPKKTKDISKDVSKNTTNDVGSIPTSARVLKFMSNQSYKPLKSDISIQQLEEIISAKRISWGVLVQLDIPLFNLNPFLVHFYKMYFTHLKLNHQFAIYFATFSGILVSSFGINAESIYHKLRHQADLTITEFLYLLLSDPFAISVEIDWNKLFKETGFYDCCVIFVKAVHSCIEQLSQISVTAATIYRCIYNVDPYNKKVDYGSIYEPGSGLFEFLHSNFADLVKLFPISDVLITTPFPFSKCSYSTFNKYHSDVKESSQYDSCILHPSLVQSYFKKELMGFVYKLVTYVQDLGVKVNAKGHFYLRVFREEVSSFSNPETLCFNDDFINNLMFHNKNNLEYPSYHWFPWKLCLPENSNNTYDGWYYRYYKRVIFFNASLQDLSFKLDDVMLDCLKQYVKGLKIESKSDGSPESNLQLDEKLKVEFDLDQDIARYH